MLPPIVRMNLTHVILLGNVCNNYHWSFSSLYYKYFLLKYLQLISAGESLQT